jgi:hypothetical protein
MVTLAALGGVGGLDEGAEAFGFDHAESFLSHGKGKLEVTGSEGELLEQFGVRAGDDVGADELADALGGIGAGFDGGFDAADVAFDEDGDEAAADLDLAGEGDAGRFDHRVAGFDSADVALGFNHSE